jgi:hypothetical protein
VRCCTQYLFFCTVKMAMESYENTKKVTDVYRMHLQGTEIRESYVTSNASSLNKDLSVSLHDG